MSLSLFKIFLAAQMTLTTGASSAVLATNFASQQEDHSFQVDSMMELIKSKSKVLSTEQKLNFKNQEFNGWDELNKYIYDNDLIQEYSTSSNLNKIIKDHQNNILDENKMYGTDLEDFELVYRDAFGNAQTSREKSLNSFTNKGLVKQKYSYDYLGWYDSPTEAKDNFVYKSGLEKSLYYQVDQRYYNLFNPIDQQEFKSSLTDGYYLKPSNFTDKEKVFGDNQKVESSVYNKFRTSWVSSNRKGATPGIEDNLNYEDYIEHETANTISITPYKGIYVQINNINYTETVSLKVKEKVVVEDFSLKNQYRQSSEKYETVSKYIYSKTVETIDGPVELKLFPIKGKNPRADVDFNRVNFSNNFNSNVELYSKKLTDMKKGEKNKYLIYELKNLDYNINKAHDISSQDVLKMYNAWFPYFIKDELLNLNGIERGQFNKYGVKRDYLYDINGRKGFDYSLSDGMEYYHEYVKPELYKNFVGTDKHGNNLYKVNNNFEATSEELENYLFLQGKQDIRTMYTFTGERNHSSIDGISLAATQAEAQEKLFQIERSILSKKYFAYDVYGNYQVSGNNEDEAIRKLQQKIDLQARYVHKDEIKDWNNKTVSFENIISDGVYLTYRTMVNGKWMYFLNYHDAYNALTGNTSEQTVVTSRTVNIYLYVENKGDEKINHTYSTDAELEALANKILGYVN